MARKELLIGAAGLLLMVAGRRSAANYGETVSHTIRL